jgi:DNA-binding transcriptional MerR regulator
MSELITRAELARQAQIEGMNVTERTIRYWAGENLLPRPVRLRGHGTRAFYSTDLLEMVRALVALRPAKIKSLREQVYEMQTACGIQADMQTDMQVETPRTPKTLETSETLDIGKQEQFKVLSTPISWSGQSFDYRLYTLADSSGDLLLLKKKKVTQNNTKQDKGR